MIATLIDAFNFLFINFIWKLTRTGEPDTNQLSFAILLESQFGPETQKPVWLDQYPKSGVVVYPAW